RSHPAFYFPRSIPVLARNPLPKRGSHPLFRKRCEFVGWQLGWIVWWRRWIFGRRGILWRRWSRRKLVKSRHLLSKIDADRVVSAIADVENHTSGEIRVAISHVSRVKNAQEF